jgi:hypothetical protein
MVRKKFNESNFLDLRPRRIRRWETDERGRVTVFIPKFRGRLFGPWLTSLLKSQDFKVKLDELGSAVWEYCDGALTVHEIGEKLRDRFGHHIEPVYDRLVVFVSQMIRGDLVTCDPAGKAPPDRG